MTPLPFNLNYLQKALSPNTITLEVRTSTYVFGGYNSISYLLFFVCMCAQSCLTLCSPMNCRPPGFSGYGIFHARILEWVVISSSRRSSLPKDQTWVSCIAGGSLLSEPREALKDRPKCTRELSFMWIYRSLFKECFFNVLFYLELIVNSPFW